MGYRLLGVPVPLRLLKALRVVYHVETVQDKPHELADGTFCETWRNTGRRRLSAFGFPITPFMHRTLLTWDGDA